MFISLLAAWLETDPKDGTLKLLDIRLVGASPANAKKLLFTVIFIAMVVALNYLLRGLAQLIIGRVNNDRVIFWTRQGIRLPMALLLLFGIASIWFSDPARLATALGLVTAGVAFALQRVITAFAGYLVILRGKTFSIGDRIVMGGVRGDVIALGFMQTTIMEMGQPPPVQNADPAMWVKSRQYTGRIVTVTNDKIFDTPVFNYTRDFPFIWEELTLPISYKDDRHKAEEILRDVAERCTVKVTEMSEEHIAEMERRYQIRRSDIHPRVYWRLTDNWLEMTVRFVSREFGVRDLKDEMSREIMKGLDAAKIGIASGTYEIVGLPPVRVEVASSDRGVERP
jgi:small-conductance mechanosensitive channel